MDNTRRSVMARVIRFLVLLVLLVLYVVSFWGNYQWRFWPGPVRAYAGWATRAAWAAWRWYCRHVGVGGGNVALQHHLVWLAVSVVLGGVVPLVLMIAMRRRPSDVGLGLPNRWGRRMILVGLGVVMLMAAVFAFERRAKPDPVAAAIGVREGLILIGVSVPEHVLLTGVAVALLLPGMRLPTEEEKSKSQKETPKRRNAEIPKRRNTETPECGIAETPKSQNVKTSKRRNAENEAPGSLPGRVLCWLRFVLLLGVVGHFLYTYCRRLLPWLGLGLPARPGDSAGRRLLAWWGLEPDGWWAILGGGLLFGIVHVGARPIEFSTSFPGGLLLCYVTYRSRSIWPGWCVHVAQMALVIVLLALFGGARR